MPRPTLFDHPKFHRLVHMLQMPEPHVLGHLEYLWRVGYSAGNPIIGDAFDVEIAAKWGGERGKLCEALVSVRMVDELEDGRFQIHDLHDNAPAYVKSRARMERFRHRARNGDATVTQHDAPCYASPAPAPAPAPSKTISSAAHAPPEPPVLVFPVIGINGHEWSLTDRQITEWVELFPTLDVLAEARKALAWVRSDLGHRKTARGMPRFLTRWLTRATDDRGGRSGQESKPRSAAIFSPADPNAVAWLEECRTLHGGACGLMLSKHLERMAKAKATA